MANEESKKMTWEAGLEAIESAWSAAENEYGPSGEDLDTCLVAVGVDPERLKALRTKQKAEWKLRQAEGERDL